MKKGAFLIGAMCLLFGIFVFAQDPSVGTTPPVPTETATPPATPTEEPELTAADFTTTPSATVAEATTCMKNAIQTRDTAIKGAMDTYDASWNTAFAARTTSFVAALDKAKKKEKRAALTEAWKVYKKAIKDARAAKKTTVNKVWKDYRTALKSCKGDTAKFLKLESGAGDLVD